MLRAVPALVLIAVLSLSAAQDPTDSTTNYNDKINSIESKPSARLDPYIRKALLKALSELEEGEQTTGYEDTSGTSIDFGETLPTEQTKEGIQIHSFVVDGQSAFLNSTNNTPTHIDNNFSILSTTVGNVENQLSSSQPTLSPYNEILQARATGNIHQRSIGSTQKTVVDTEKQTTYKPITKTTKLTPTTTTTTTTTTPKPTHNDDGENIEDVDKRDVQVFQAPLVAAFTVHQDAHGQPKQVIPLFQQTNSLTAAKPLSSPILPSVIAPTNNINFNQRQSEYTDHQLSLHRQLEEKQLILEEQLRALMQQQREQEELLRRQQIILQQREAQRQQQLILEQNQLSRQQIPEQQRLPTTSPANFQTQKSVQTSQFLNQNVGLRPQASQVLIQSSLPLEHPNLASNQQQLPNREAVDFLLHLRNQQRDQFPLQENHLPQGITTFLQPAPVQQVFHQGVNLNQLRPSNDFGLKQNTRVFRQEAGVGNFGFNHQQNFNRLNSFGPVYTNRFFPGFRQNQYNADLELQHLLAQNAINGRSHEDLNIVSKVLSLNHGIPLNNNVSNRLPFDSRRHV